MIALFGNKDNSLGCGKCSCLSIQRRGSLRGLWSDGGNSKDWLCSCFKIWEYDQFSSSNGDIFFSVFGKLFFVWGEAAMYLHLASSIYTLDDIAERQIQPKVHCQSIFQSYISQFFPFILIL